MERFGQKYHRQGEEGQMPPFFPEAQLQAACLLNVCQTVPFWHWCKRIWLVLPTLQEFDLFIILI
jgi:hypothetical protein